MKPHILMIAALAGVTAALLFISTQEVAEPPPVAAHEPPLPAPSESQPLDETIGLPAEIPQSNEYREYQRFQDFQRSILEKLANPPVSDDDVDYYMEQIELYASQRKLIAEEAMLLRSQLIAKSNATDAQKLKAVEDGIRRLEAIQREAPVDERVNRYKEVEKEIIARVRQDSSLSPEQQSQKISDELAELRSDIYGD